MDISLSIGAVEQDTGLSKDILRVWERRYGFPQPVRDASGERAYPIAQVERLRMIKRLIDRGHRPGKLLACSDVELEALCSQEPRRGFAPEAIGDRTDLLRYVELCKAYCYDELRHALSQELLQRGLHRFVIDIVAPLNRLVGVCWAEGNFAVFEEHLYTESIQIVMRSAIASIPPVRAQARPRILLTTFPQELHGLGLLMAEAILSLNGARCISLGTQTPVTDIARAAQTQRADIVALSFSASMNTKQLTEGVQGLRALLPPHIEIWAGGSAPGLVRRPPPELRVLDLHDIAAALTRWRAAHPDQAVLP